MTVFGAFFTVFMVEFRNDRDPFAESSALLHPAIGLTNTLVLLVSSYLVVLAIQAGHTPASTLFFTLYFAFTGVHLAHVTIGATLLAAWRRRVRRRTPWEESRVFAESAIAFGKVFLVGQDFMGLREAHPVLRGAFLLWVCGFGLTCSILCVV